jgi:hypothetical protein
MTKQTNSKTKSSNNPKCQVRPVGVDHFAECPQPGPQPCAHAMPFGYCFLCTHPQVDEMLENSRQAAVIVHSMGE